MREAGVVQQTFTPPAMQAISDQYRLSQAVRVGDIIWLSGQVGVTAERTVPEGLEAQTRQAFENLKSVLETAGATLDDIVEMTLLFTGDTSDLGAFHQIKDEYIRPPYPAITGYTVAALAVPALVLEIRAVAVAGSAPKE